ncbi:hypothetical protein Moror_9536 [Moniliophthora roreri MCA 2997]|uniref:BTB domain-containing protein n=1 Tax=Moniliophthora roreri (strain MCA 2997) TaxID=1381753 RepID=V2XF99_MONRO|nr:hypothetical protein Moror_9536 [Moniliophthora roreri MCA 2997]
MENYSLGGSFNLGLVPKCEAIEGCLLPVDIILKSSDSVLLGAHSRNLELFSEGFPLEGSTTHELDVVVELTEDANTLKLFLAFTHNHRHVDLSRIDIDLVLALGDAAEKYGNHSAFVACSMALRYGDNWVGMYLTLELTNRTLAEHSGESALKVLRFKAVHSDLELIDEVARRTMDVPILAAMRIFGPHHNQFRIWVSFVSQRRPCSDYG